MKRTILLVAIFLFGLILTSDVGGQRRKTQRQTQPKPPPSKPAPTPTPTAEVPKGAPLAAEQKVQPSAEQKEVDAVIYRIPLGQACRVTAKTGDVVDRVAALETNYSVSPTRRFAAAYGEHRTIFEKAKAGASQPDAIASAFKAVAVARALDLIDAIMTAHQNSPQGQFDEAYRAGERDLKAAQAVDWRSGDLDAGQRKALYEVMRAHGIDLAGALSKLRDLILAGRYSVTLSARADWKVSETKEESEWASRATWGYGLSGNEGKAVCAMLVAIYRDNARASEKSAQARKTGPAARQPTPAPTAKVPKGAPLAAESKKAARSFSIVTKPFLAFKDGSSVYKLGQPMSGFLASFGSAEKIVIDEELYAKDRTQEEYAKAYLAYTKSHYYGNHGVVITEDKGGAIFGITCYVVASKSDAVGAILPANCRTEEGITFKSSLGEIIERYGAPFRRRMWEYSNTSTYPERLEVHVDIYYKYGDDVLCFGFKDGRLETIGLYAKYVPILERP